MKQSDLTFKLVGKKIYLLILLVISLSTLQAQIRISSPYSRYGIGDVIENNNTKLLSMGNIGIGYRSPTSVNYINPASYTSIDSISFVFEGSLISLNTDLSTSELTQKSNYTSLASVFSSIEFLKHTHCG